MTEMEKNPILFQISSFEKVDANFLYTMISTALHIVTELTQLTHQNNILIVDASKLDLGRFHSNVFVH